MRLLGGGPSSVLGQVLLHKCSRCVPQLGSELSDSSVERTQQGNGLPVEERLQNPNIHLVEFYVAAVVKQRECLRQQVLDHLCDVFEAVPAHLVQRFDIEGPLCVR